jgi:hypothetical protein
MFLAVFALAWGFEYGQHVFAQAPPPPPQTQQAPYFNPQELDQLVSPVALYPDPLLA